MDLAAAWSISFDPHDGIKCYAMLSGMCWIDVEGNRDPWQPLRHYRERGPSAAGTLPIITHLRDEHHKQSWRW